MDPAGVQVDGFDLWNKNDFDTKISNSDANDDPESMVSKI